MAAFVVVAPPAADAAARTGTRLSIFPGSAIPSVFAAHAPFWIGYGFVPGPGDSAADQPSSLDRGTRFELEVDGRPISMVTDVEQTEGREPTSKQSVANFGGGLPPGWHRFSGRWYDAGSLVLTSERSIQFVEA